MALLINPGSQIGTTGTGWTNTVEAARAEAERWLAQMHADGMTDVELLPDATEGDGRWSFKFLHTVTGKVVHFETHGIDDVDAYCKVHTFTPRIYWNGSSSSGPWLGDFAAEGFEAVRTYRAVSGGADASHEPPPD